MGRVRRAAAVVVMVPVAGVALLGVEVFLAQQGRHLATPPLPSPEVLAGPPGPADTLAVWLGDSTAAGVGASGAAGALPRQVADQLARPVRLTVLARSGARVADVLRTQVPAMAGMKPNIVFISVGANDATHLTSRAHFRRDYARVLAGLPTGDGQVVLLGVPDLGAPPRLAQPLRALAGWRGRALDADVRALAVRTHARYADIARRTGPAFRRHPGVYFAADRYHPDDAGYRLWAAAVAASVAPAH
ncbi:MAG TPA: GDSL-type esterase/lipase family protein [Acidimicrobiales bacterium]|nr:GDSL-type esterase/lipase family protein [Acidimicrobiales bacterium]